MKPKILVIGGSHSGAMVGAYNQKKEDRSLELSHFACAGFSEKHYKFENNCLEAKSKRSNHFLSRTKQPLKQYPENYDLIVFFSHRFHASRIAQLLLDRKYLYSADPNDWPRHFEHYNPVSENVFKTGIGDVLSSSWEYKLIHKMRESIDTPILLMEGPGYLEYRAGIAEYPRTLRHINRLKNPEKIEQLILETAQEIYGNVPNLALILQPKHTKSRALFTRAKFMSNARHVLWNDTLKDTIDITHANQKYGRIQLQQVENYLQSNLMSQQSEKSA